MSYRQRLVDLDARLSLIEPVASRLVLLTGQSSFRSSRLEPAQIEFLRAVAPPGVETLECGLPYHASFDVEDRPGSLISASIRNARQFCWSLFLPSYRGAIASVLGLLLRNTRESLYIVTGSCGLQILASAWGQVQIPEGMAVRVVAIGPALIDAGTFPLDRIQIVQGKRDVWTRLLFRGKPTARCESGHLDYWTSQDARDLVARMLREGEPI